MANITVAGNAAVITLGTSLEDLHAIKKHNPAALTLRGGEDNKEIKFLVTLGAKGCLEPTAACFADKTEDGLAQITVLIDTATADRKEYVADKYGYALTCLNKLEATFPDVLAGIAETKSAIMANITVAQ